MFMWWTAFIQKIDGGEANDKIIAVFENDYVWVAGREEDLS